MTFGIWTDERTAELKRLWGAGLSASQVAAQLGGITRNAVIGKVHRLGLEKRGVTAGTRRSTKAAKPRGLKISVRVSRTNANGNGLRVSVAHEPAEVTTLRCVEIVPRHIGLIALEPNDCRYPYGDGPITFCGHPTMKGSSYCAPHFHLSRGPGTASERSASKIASRHLEAA